MLQQLTNSKKSEIFDSLPVCIQKMFLNANDDRFNPVFAPMSFYVFYNALVEDPSDPRGVLVAHLTREGFLHYRFISHIMANDYGLLYSVYMNVALKPRSYFEFLNLFFFLICIQLYNILLHFCRGNITKLWVMFLVILHICKYELIFSTIM